MACGGGCCGASKEPLPPRRESGESAREVDGCPTTAKSQNASASGTGHRDDDGEQDDCCGGNSTLRKSAIDAGHAMTKTADIDDRSAQAATAKVKDSCCAPRPCSSTTQEPLSTKDTACGDSGGGCCNKEDEHTFKTSISAKSCCVGIERTTGGCCSKENHKVVNQERGTDGRCGKKDNNASKKGACANGCYETTRDEISEQETRLNECCAGKDDTVSENTCKEGCCGEEDNDSEEEVCADGCCEKRDNEPSKQECANGCCGETTNNIQEETSCNTKTCADECCGGSSNSVSSNENVPKPSCGDGCCGDTKPPTVTVALVPPPQTKTATVTDIEKGISQKEHIVLSISGMTCTGCETKLQRTLGTVNSISNLKTSLVLARAEFDLNGTDTADDIVKHLHRTTEFKCERISSQGSSIDIICSGNVGGMVNGQWPDGVIDVRMLEKQSVRVEFDPKVIGARDLVENGWEEPTQLAPPQPDPGLGAGSKHVRNVGYMTALSALLTIPVLVLAWAPLPENEIAYGSASLALATIVQVVIAGPFYPKALKAFIFSRIIEMDLLIVLSTSAAYTFSVVSFGYLVAGSPLATGQFFETSTLLVTLIMVGRFMASLARQKAAESISIRSLQTPTAILLEKGKNDTEIDARLLQYGDVFKVMPDSRIPTDGVVITGSSEVDESMVTGESLPVDKHPGHSVIAGSINGSGTLIVRLTRLPGNNTISTIASMVDEAKLSKPRIQDLADRVASYFVPVVVVLTIITFVIWIAVGVAVRQQSGSEAVVQALTYAITVLIVSCPCAIGLAVPMVVVIASGVAARKGVIFKSSNSIEIAYKATHVVLDKTGTLTQGELTVAREKYLSADPALTKSVLLGLISNMKHPVSVAVATHLKSQNVSPHKVLDPKTLTGKGVEGQIEGKTVRAGNSRWLGLSDHSDVQMILSQGLTAFCCTIDDVPVAVFGLEDSLRPDALTTISTLQQSNISVHVLSGDDDGAVRTITSRLNIPDSNVHSRCTPASKQSYIQSLVTPPPSSHPQPTKSKPAKPPTVIFIGDGTNDAVALATASIGIHMSTGTDIAQSAADVVLTTPRLSGILTTMALSKAAIHRIAFNFGWSFVYNLFAVLLGAGAFVNARIPPEFAGLGELVSVLPVIAAAVALRWVRV